MCVPCVPSFRSVCYEGQLKSPGSDIYSLAIELKFFVCCNIHILYKHLSLIHIYLEPTEVDE